MKWAEPIFEGKLGRRMALLTFGLLLALWIRWG